MASEKSSGRASLPTPNSTASFWHSEPSKLLLGHRTTPELPPQADYVIVGSGITGTSVARFLAEDERARGASVVMLEAREACWGATGRNGGHCQPLLFDRAPDVGAFELRNYDAVRRFIEANDIPCEWRSLLGCRTFWQERVMKATIRDVEELKRRAPELGNRIKIVTDDAGLKENRVIGAKGATLTYMAGSLWPYKYVTWILEWLVNGGKLNLQTITPVTKIESCSQISEDGNAAACRYQVHTPRGSVKARNLILATNGYSSSILPSFADLIVPVRGEMSSLLPPKGMERLQNSYGFVGALGQGAHDDDYLVQRPFSGVPNPAGHLMFGGGRGVACLETVGVSDDSIIDEASAAYLRRSLLKMLDLGGESSGKEELEATHQWTGIMGYSRDNHPWIGAVPDMPRGLWLAAGYTGHGMPNGTLCGKAIVQMMLAERDGVAAESIQDEMVRQGDLPRSYLITKERIKNVKQLPVVAEGVALGLLGTQVAVSPSRPSNL